MENVWENLKQDTGKLYIWQVIVSSLKAPKGMRGRATRSGMEFVLSESWPLAMSSNGCMDGKLIAEAPLWEALPSSRGAMLSFTYIFTCVVILCIQCCLSILLFVCEI